MTSSKAPIVLEQSSPDTIDIVAEFPNLEPRALFDYWIKPELLNRWWPPVAELKPESHGAYHFSWPSQGWHLRGTFTEFHEGKQLGFTWKWDHESTDITEVRLTFEPRSTEGTKLTLHHGRYSQDETGKKTREEHIEGWMYFLGKLQELAIRPSAMASVPSEN